MGLNRGPRKGPRETTEAPRDNAKAALAYIKTTLADNVRTVALRYGLTTDVALGDLAADILINSRERVALKKPIAWKALMERGPTLAERMTKELRG